MTSFLWTYITGTVSMLAVNCLTHPENLGPCLRVWEWVPPYIADVRQLQEVPAYQQEKAAVASYEKHLQDQNHLHR